MFTLLKSILWFPSIISPSNNSLDLWSSKHILLCVLKCSLANVLKQASHFLGFCWPKNSTISTNPIITARTFLASRTDTSRWYPCHNTNLKTKKGTLARNMKPQMYISLNEIRGTSPFSWNLFNLSSNKASVGRNMFKQENAKIAFSSSSVIFSFVKRYCSISTLSNKSRVTADVIFSK